MNDEQRDAIERQLTPLRVKILRIKYEANNTHNKHRKQAADKELATLYLKKYSLKPKSYYR